jgi:uncharacterized membrane protein YfhO
MNRFKEWCKDNRIYILAFVMPFITLLAVFIGAKVYPFGDRSFLHIDMYHQYFPMLVDFYRAIKGSGVGSGCLYSWNAGLGSNMVAEYAYYLASPFNFIALLFPEKYLIEFQSYMVVIKTGFMGVTCAYYLSKHFDVKRMSVAYFATFYALSGYMAAYNWNVMWIDVIVLAPLVILGLEQLVKEGKYKLYTVTLALSVFSNYYLSIMLCIFLVLYYLLVLLPSASEKLKSFFNFALYSILGGGMAAVLLIPTLMALQLSKFSAGSIPDLTAAYFSIFDMLARHMMDVAVETGLDHWPNIYCSVAVLFLIPLYVICKNVNRKEKVGRLSLLLFMLISFSCNILTYIWHGMNYPDSLPSRQSFLYILLVITMSYEAFLYIKNFEKATLYKVFAGAGIFIVLCQKLVTDDAFSGVSFLLTGVFLAIYSVLVYIYNHGEKAKECLICLTVIAVIIEAGTNTMLTSVPTVSREDYLENYDTYNTLYEENNRLAEGELYRFENVDNRVRNDDSMLHNYMSTSLFSSTSNGLAGSFYKNYGMRTSKVFYCHDGMTPLISGLLSNRYLFYEEPVSRNDLMTFIDTEENVLLYEYNKSLPFGYMIHNSDTKTNELVKDEATAFSLIDGDIPDEDADLNPLQRQNVLVNNLGIEGELYTYVNEQYSGSEYVCFPDEAGYMSAYADTKRIATINAKTSEGDKSFKKMKNPYVMNLGYCEAGEGIYINDEDKEKDLHLTMYRMNTDVYEAVMDKLSQDTMKIESFSSSEIKAQITASEEGYLILSMPYDPGITVYVDGVKAEKELFCEMMTAVYLSKGDHDIRISYFPKGFGVGIGVSLLFVALFVLRCLLEKKKSVIKS